MGHPKMIQTDVDTNSFQNLIDKAQEMDEEEKRVELKAKKMIQEMMGKLAQDNSKVTDSNHYALTERYSPFK